MAGNISRILIVDDDAFIRDVLAMVLESENFSVDCAENGKEALEKFTQNSEFDLVISDLNMPVMGGLELMKRIRAGKPGTSFIFLSGSEVAFEAIDAEAAECLAKDENIQESIIAAVQRVAAKC
ncbi:MAG: response regulator [Candidatus Riflebacteria bacterium]|nr:response regulator [Candidatus Riflebacteria bacterium]